MAGVDSIVSEPAIAVSCPRCGYDQRGVIAQWTDTCDLDGRCTECGLAFEWARVLNPKKFAPPWSVECARGLRGCIKSCFATSWRLLVPWHFWTRMDMSIEVRWRRLAVLVLFLFVLFATTYVIEQTTVAVRVRLIMAEWLQDYPSKEETINDFESQIAEFEAMQRDNGRPLRSWYYSPDEIDAELTRLRALLATVQSNPQHEPVINYPLHVMMFESAFHPTAQFSSGFADLGVYGTQPLPAPSEYHELVAMDVQVIQSWSFDVQPLIVLGALFLGLATTLAVCIPIAFILLPISRRRAKVRWRHIWRVGVYTSATGLLVVLILLVAGTAAFLIPGSLDQPRLIYIAAGFLPALAIAVSWAVAIRRYLCMPHDWAIVLLFSILSVLIVGAVTGLLGALAQTV